MQKYFLVSAAFAVAPALATPAVNVYFGQSGTNSLGSYCESDAFEYVTIGFVNTSPEQDPSGLGYPGTNFAAHCAADVYTKDGIPSNLLAKCTFIAEDIPKCQAAGKKVLLSVGGYFSSANNYTVSSAANGVAFADFLWGAFGPYDGKFDGPRPFDFNGNHVSVDGFDFDIEAKFDNPSGYIALLQALRSHITSSSGNYLITGAPECPLSDEYFKMKEMITQTQFDILWIQFYNNPSCDAIIGNDGIGEAFNYNQWETFLKTTRSKDAKLFIGLPGSSVSADSGYLEPGDAAVLFKLYENRPSFGGAMIWDVNTGSQLISNGRTYIENIHDVVCGPPTARPTSISSTAYSTASSVQTSRSSETATTPAGSYTTQSATRSSTATPVSSITTTYSPSQSSTASPTQTSSSSLTTSVFSTRSSAESTTETTTRSSTQSPTVYSTTTPTGSYTQSAAQSSSQTSARPSTPTTGISAEPTSRTPIRSSDEYSSQTPTQYYTRTSVQSYPTSAQPTTSKGTAVPTSSTPYSELPTLSTKTRTRYPTRFSSQLPTEATAQSSAPTHATSASLSSYSWLPTGYPTESQPESLSASTRYSSTETSGRYPTSEVSSARQAYSTSSGPLTTNTIYTTTVRTVTSCAAEATSCPLHGVTTETIPLYTTVCPVKDVTSTLATSTTTATVQRPAVSSTPISKAHSSYPTIGNYGVQAGSPTASYPTGGTGSSEPAPTSLRLAVPSGSPQSYPAASSKTTVFTTLTVMSEYPTGSGVFNGGEAVVDTSTGTSGSILAAPTPSSGQQPAGSVVTAGVAGRNAGGFTLIVLAAATLLLMH